MLDAARLLKLSRWLNEWRPIWEERPFIQQPTSWEGAHPELARWLRQLPDEAIDRLEQGPEQLLEGPNELAQWVREGMALSALEPARAAAVERLRERWAWHVPGRKQAQVRAMAAALLAQLPNPPARWIDWCAGKGHLGRALGVLSGAPVLFVERQQALCQQAEARAAAEGVSANALVADVLVDAPELRSGFLVGLHTCGVLADRALGVALAADIDGVAVVPCCYHHQPGEPRLPVRSRAGQLAPLRVAPRQLRFATAEEVAAPDRRRRARKRDEGFRLALDLLLREASGEDVYHALPPLPRPWLQLPFSQWLDRVSRAHQLSLPAQFDASRFEQHGFARAQLARALGLARTPFRRALEMWVVFDRALWLQDKGYRVTVERLWPRTVSPRNVLITGRRT